MNKLLTILITLSLVACGADTESTVSSPSNALVGTWRGECASYNSYYKIKGEMVVTDTTMEVATVWYYQNDCLTPHMKTVYTATYATSGQDLDMTTVKKEIAFISDDAVYVANAMSDYSYSDWKSGELKDISGRTSWVSGSKAEVSSGQVVYTIYKIEGSVFYGSSTATDKTQRPTVFASNGMTKQ